MKNFRRGFICAVIFCILALSCVDSWAGAYLGEFCWGMKEYPGDRFKMGITSIEGNHFLINGVEFQQDGSKKALLGNAEIIDSSIVMTVTVAYTGVDDDKGSYVCSKVGEIVLDSTLKGTLAMVHTVKYADGSSKIGDIYHSLIPVSCP